MYTDLVMNKSEKLNTVNKTLFTVVYRTASCSCSILNGSLDLVYHLFTVIIHI